MAHAGGTRPSVELQIIDGVLVVGASAQRIGTIRDIDMAVQELLRGRRIFLQQYGDLQRQVERTVEMALKGGGKWSET